MLPTLLVSALGVVNRDSFHVRGITFIEDATGFLVPKGKLFCLAPLMVFTHQKLHDTVEGLPIYTRTLTRNLQLSHVANRISARPQTQVVFFVPHTPLRFTMGTIYGVDPTQCF